MFALSHINHLHTTLKTSSAHSEPCLKKENTMLYDQSGKQVHVPHGKELTDNQKRNLQEVNEPQDYHGHKMFRLEERAHIIEHN